MAFRAEHVLGVTSSATMSQCARHVVEHVVLSEMMMRSAEECEMSRSCHSAMFSRAVTA